MAQESNGFTVNVGSQMDSTPGRSSNGDYTALLMGEKTGFFI